MSKELVLNLASRGVLSKQGKHCDDIHLTTSTCYSHGSKYTSTISVSGVISEYYLSGSQLLKPPVSPQVFQPSPYCNIGTKRSHFHVTPDPHFGFDRVPNSMYTRGQALLGFNATKDRENVYVSLQRTNTWHYVQETWYS